ncbi:MAG: hypothetical protein ACETWT_14960 [Thermodesulfobacteriota bacterium]
MVNDETLYHHRQLVKKDEKKYIYRKLNLRDNVVIGCILSGDLRGNREILNAIEEKKNVAHLKGEIVGGDFLASGPSIPQLIPSLRLGIFVADKIRRISH